MTKSTFKGFAVGLAVAGAVGFAAPAFAGDCAGGYHATKSTTTADGSGKTDTTTTETKTLGQSTSTVLTKSTKTTVTDG